MQNKLLSLAAIGGFLAFFVYLCTGLMDESHDEQVRAHDKAAQWAAEAP